MKFITQHLQNNMSKMRKFTLLLTIMVLPALLFSQTRISVKSADSLAFTIKINDVAINQYPCFVTSFDFPASGKLNAEITFPSSPASNFTQIINLKKNYSQFFEVEKSKGVLKLVLKSESLLEKNLAENLQKTSQEIKDADMTNTAEDSTHQASSACGLPVTDTQYQQLLLDVKESYFESRKLETMKQFLSTNCVSVEQMRYMMSRLSMEDNKIILLKAANGHISDVGNVNKVEEDFFLQKNKAMVYEITRSMQAAASGNN